MNLIKHYYFKIPEIIRFTMVLMLNTLMGYLIIYFTYKLYKYLNYSLLLLVVTFLIISFSFITNKFLVFRYAGAWYYQYFKTYLVYIMNILYNAIIVVILTKFLNLNWQTAQIIATIFIFILTYFLLKYFAFKDLQFKLFKK